MALLIGLGTVYGALWIVDRMGAPAKNKPQELIPVGPAIAKGGPYPKAVVDSTVHEFGSMVVGKTGEHTFIIRNEGEAPLILTKGQTTCKCTISEMPDGNVPPGGQVEVLLKWSPKMREPEFSQKATIHTNDPDHKDIELFVTGNVTTLFDLIPPDSWIFPDVPEDQPVTQNGILISQLLEDFEIESVESSKPSIGHEISAISKDDLLAAGGKSGYRLKVIVNPDKGVGGFNETLTIKVRAKDQEPESRVIALVGQRLGPIRITGPAWQDSSMSLSMGGFDSAKGRKMTLSLFVRGAMAGNFQFVKQTVDPTVLKVELVKDDKFRAQGDSQRYQLSFEVPPGVKGNRTGENSAVVKVQTNHPKVPEMTLHVHFVSY
jgi:hypothetical protein